MDNLYEELGSFRAVAKIVGCDHKTVKARVIRQAERHPLQRASLADPYREVIGGKLDGTAGQITAKALLRILRGAGYGGSARTLCRAVAVERAAWRGAQRQRVYRPWESAPGDVLVVDWGHVGTVRTAAGQRPLSVFCAVLGWSRYRFIRLTTSQKFAAPAGCLATCLEHLHGVPARVMFDNPKTVTTSFVARQSVFNLDLVRLAAHYPFSPITAAAADPESKGKVEALVRFVKSDCVPTEGFSSLDEANPLGSTVDGRGRRRGASGDACSANRTTPDGTSAAASAAGAALGGDRGAAQGGQVLHGARGQRPVLGAGDPGGDMG